MTYTAQIADKPLDATVLREGKHHLTLRASPQDNYKTFADKVAQVVDALNAKEPTA